MPRELFYELIRVSIGKQDILSHNPSQAEWNQLYEMAKKQSLIGICFAGVQKLRKNEAANTLSSKTYMLWLGCAAKIQQRNELMNSRCEKIQNFLLAEGKNFCVLKGQGNAQYYGMNLAKLRQSGDIDIWLDGDFENILSFLCSINNVHDINEIHIHWDFFSDVDVEIHFTPSFLSNRVADKRLQKWFELQKEWQFRNINDVGLHVPTDYFNQIFLLLHIYRHLFGEGIGLRQIMDLYFAFLPRTDATKKLLSSFGLSKFEKAINWVMWYVFEGEDPSSDFFSSKNTDKIIGSFILSEIEQMGNFGQKDERFKLSKHSSHFYRFFQMIIYKMRFVNYFPLEVFWQPIDIIRRFFNYRIMKQKVIRIKENCM